MITLVVCMAKNRCIGKDGVMPWQCASELQHFKRITSNHMLLMGRTTYESITAPFSNRTLLVLSSKKQGSLRANATWVKDITAVLTYYKEHSETLMVCGGASVYEQSLPYADEIYVSVLHDSYEGDRFFPMLDTNVFTCIHEDVQQEYTCYHMIRRKA